MILAAFFDRLLAAIIVASTFFPRWPVGVFFEEQRLSSSMLLCCVGGIDRGAVWEAAVVNSKDVLFARGDDSSAGWETTCRI